MEHLPPPEAYGRVTDPQRYRVLHVEARNLVERLAQRYTIERREGLDLDDELTRGTVAESVVRLVPSPAGAAPLTIAFTRFPGLVVRFGRWHIEAYPACGCDACAEDPTDLVGLLLARVETVVAGGFSEGVTAGGRPWLTHEFAGVGSGGIRLDRTDPRTSRAPFRQAWLPWQPEPEVTAP